MSVDHPGFVRTRRTADVPEDFLTIPLGSSTDPVEVTTMVVILANDESSDRTGSEFAVDAACSAAYRTEPHER